MILNGGKLEAIYRQANTLMANFNLLVQRGKMANFMASTTSRNNSHTLSLTGEAHPPNNYFDDKIINVGMT